LSIVSLVIPQQAGVGGAIRKYNSPWLLRKSALARARQKLTLLFQMSGGFC